MADKQSEALRRADALEQYAIDANSGDPRIVEAVAELRRLAAVEAERNALRETLKLARSIIGHPDDAHSQMIDATIAKSGGGNG